MNSLTEQRKKWEDEFGAEYLKRNLYEPTKLDEFYLSLYGVSRGEMNYDFLNDIQKDVKILEVGTNVGNQLKYLQSMGFTNLYGIEIQDRAIEFSKQTSRGLNIIKGDALDIPFKDGFFDLVFTSGVLIHISPENIEKAITEIYRVTNKYIWGLEYYAPDYTEIIYRGEKNLLWKTDFKKLYMDTFKDLQEIKEKKFIYLEDNNLMDQMYLLQKEQK